MTDSRQSLAAAFADPTGSVLVEGINDQQILKAVFLAGAGGAGKSGIVDAMFAGLGFKVINPDKHLERFLRAAKIPPAEAGEHYTLFNKARDLKEREFAQYASRRLPLIIDGTGWNFDRIAGPVKHLRDLGYDTYMVVVDVSLETAMKRNEKRAAAGKRRVPDSFVQDAHEGLQRALPRYKKLFGPRNMIIINNDADIEPRLWKAVIAPKLRRVANRILSAPVKNPVGRAWIKKQSDPKTADLDAPRADAAPAQWPKFTGTDPEKKNARLWTKKSREPEGLAAKFSSQSSSGVLRFAADAMRRMSK